MKNTAKEKLFCVYVHTNKINNHRYIGITSRNVNKRWGLKGQRYKNNKHFWSAIQKYGWDNFTHEIVAENLTFEEAQQMEKDLINKYDSANPKYGYNHTFGGEGGQVFTEESRKKMSDAWKGRIITPEWRKHLSEAGKGRIPANKGKHLSIETIEKLRKASIGKKHTQQSIEKMRKNSWHNTKVICDGIIFDSIAKCAEYLELGKSRKLEAWLRGENSMPSFYKDRGLGYRGVKAEYIEDTSSMNDKAVICDNHYFPSMSACDRYYGLKRMSTACYLSGHTKMPQEFIDKGLRYADRRYWYKVIDKEDS